MFSRIITRLRFGRPKIDTPGRFDEIERSQALLIEGDRLIHHRLYELRSLLTKMADSEALQFSDIKAAVTQLVNDNTASNNAIAAQLKEVQELLLDFAAKSQSGEPVSQADYQTVISQLAAIHSSVTANTASVQASTAAIQQADPGEPTPIEPTPDPTVDPVAGTTGSGDETVSSSSSHGLGE
jgi:hypothetical protein